MLKSYAFLGELGNGENGYLGDSGDRVIKLASVVAIVRFVLQFDDVRASP